MKEIKLIVKHENGLHARPASELVALASKYQSKITIRKREKMADLKSILGLLSLGIGKNDEATIQIEGEDEDRALADISRLGQESALW